jgi:alcohol dehydrogenase
MHCTEPNRTFAPSSNIMQALVYLGSGKKAFQNVASPALREATDAIVRMTHTTICGTDLHILKGDLPEVTPGRVLGHEGVGVVESVGPAVSAWKTGDRVIVSCISACGICEYCRRGMFSHCTTGGWVLGHTIDGTQAELVRVPHANLSLYGAPAGADVETLVLLSDILPTGFECGVLNGRVGPGDTVAIVGAGPVGLAVLLTARLYSPDELIVIDTDLNRLECARALGATHVIDNGSGRADAAVMELTGGRGVDVAIEAVGVAATFELCQSIIGAGGRIANVGVHGQSVPLHLESLWSRNITLTTRLVDTTTIPLLLKAVIKGRIQPAKLITHRLAFDSLIEAYDVFGRAASERALKVLVMA